MQKSGYGHSDEVVWAARVAVMLLASWLVFPFVARADLTDAEAQAKLERLQKQFAGPRYTFTLRISGASRAPLENVTGLKLPPSKELRAQSKQDNQKAADWLKQEAAASGQARPSVTTCSGAKSYDLRALGLSTPVKNQNPCGSCWDFAALAALESNWIKVNGSTISASEQQILDCAPAAGSCEGGLYSSTFLHLMFQSIGSDADVPYRATRTTCNRNAANPYSASIFGWIAPFGTKPNVTSIKKAICENGAVAASMFASEAFTMYGSGVWNEMDKSPTNHAVAIIGWDDAKHAWLIKNSWGTDWGDNAGDPGATGGYAWINYDSNSIGNGAAWVRARKACPNNGEYDAGLCYERCRPGFHGLGPVCWQNCPEGWADDGATCSAPLISKAKTSHSRGAGVPMTCGDNEQQDSGLCYPRCREGFKGVGPVCWASCPAGYSDDGATCRKDAVIQPKPSQGRGVGTTPTVCGPNRELNAGLCYESCRTGFHGVGPVCWQNCPTGFRDDGAYCAKPSSYPRGAGYPWAFGDRPFDLTQARDRCVKENRNCEQNGLIWYPTCRAGFSAAGCCTCSPNCQEGMSDIGVSCQKQTSTRGVGTVPSGCGAGRQLDAGLCYPLCGAGFNGVGPVCWGSCPAGFRDDGATCRKDVSIVTKESYGRGAGAPLHDCPAGSEKNGALCYPACGEGFDGAGPVCWERCPPRPPPAFRDDGAFCTSGGVMPSPASYGRGVGTPP
jgi:C1A family cysteine protease